MAKAVRFLMLCLVALAAAAPLAAAQRAQRAAAPAPAPEAGPEQTPVVFSGGGALTPYYSGVIEVLVKEGLLTPTTPMAGQGSGALALYFGSMMGYDYIRLFEMYRLMYKGYDEFSPYNDAKELIRSLLPGNAADMVNGTFAVGLAQLDSKSTSFENSASMVVDKFYDQNEVALALAGTTCEPCAGMNATYCTFRAQPVIDGAFANGWEQLCPDGNVENCIKVTAEAVVAIDTGSAGAAGNCSVNNFPSRTEINETPFANPSLQQGGSEPITTVRRSCPADPSAPAAAPFPLPAPVQPYEFILPDIYPGKYGPLPKLGGKVTTPCMWQSWKYGLPAGSEPSAAILIYKYGMSDAQRFVAERKRFQGR